MEKQSELVKRKTTFLQFHLVFFVGVTFPLILSRISPWIRFQYLIANFEKYSRYSLGRRVFISFSNVDYFFLLLFPWIYLHTNTILNTRSVVKTSKNLHRKESLSPSNSQWQEQEGTDRLFPTGAPHLKNRNLQSSEPHAFQPTHRWRHAPRLWHTAWMHY